LFFDAPEVLTVKQLSFAALWVVFWLAILSFIVIGRELRGATQKCNKLEIKKTV
jgi:hypothetical protein